MASLKSRDGSMASRQRIVVPINEPQIPHSERIGGYSETIAVHEASHAVAHLAQRLHVRSVTLQPGYCDHGCVRPDSLTGNELFAHAVATLAGPTAVRLLCPGEDDGGTGDEADALMLAKFATTDSASWISGARDHARALVIEHTAAIMGIGTALLDPGALDYRQLRALWFSIQHPAAAALLADRERRALRSRRGDHWRGY
jgi:hypothetical protein